ncbi:MAG TPA: hypothetical protein VEY91_03680 [Candidatus Limnocylindria bacterium]|nr:hypothetical protein [Candidatus Limnocylindria bacterium]
MSTPSPAPAAPPSSPSPTAAWLWAALILLGFAVSLYRSDDTDFWFHLAAGRSILMHGLPEQETWCIAARGQAPWLSEWLFHVALRTVHGLGGDWGVAIWRGAWSAGAVALAIGLLRTVGARSWTALLLIPLALAVARERFQPRPEQLAVVFTLLYLLVFERARRGRGLALAWLLPVQILWANLHPSWVFGVAVAGFQALLPHPDSRPDRKAASSRRNLWLLFAALWAASALTPDPLGSLALPFRFPFELARDPLHASIEELRPWSWTMDRAEPFTWMLVFALAAVALGPGAWRVSPPLATIAVMAVILGLAAVRSRGLAAFLLLPVLAVTLERAPAWSRRVAQGLAGVAAFAGLLLLVLGLGFEPGVAPQWRSVPVRAVALADSLGVGGVPLNTFHYGGYILWARGESHPPLIDGRALGPPEFRSRFARALVDEGALDSLVAQWRFTHAVLSPPLGLEDRMASHLLERPEWALVFADDAGLLLLRRDLHPEAVARREYRLLSPDYEKMAELAERALADSMLAQRLVAELQRARSESPWHSRASLWLGLFELGGGKAQAAHRLLEEVERDAPATPGLALRLGIAREMVGDRDRARSAYRRALREPVDAEAARAALSRLAAGAAR